MAVLGEELADRDVALLGAHRLGGRARAGFSFGFGHVTTPTPGSERMSSVAAKRVAVRSVIRRPGVHPGDPHGSEPPQLPRSHRACGGAAARQRTLVDLESSKPAALATAFLIGYFVTSPIFGTLGDRAPRFRKRLMALGVLVWSVATFASGHAVGFWSLLAARALVGVGEASYAAVAPTIIDDMAPEGEGRSRRLAVFYLAIPRRLGARLPARRLPRDALRWRGAFYVAGAPGACSRSRASSSSIRAPSTSPREERPPVLKMLAPLAKQKLYGRAVLGYCAQTFALGGFSALGADVHRRSLQHPISTSANYVFGGSSSSAGFVGTVVGGVWASARRSELERDGRGACARALLRDFCARSAAPVRVRSRPLAERRSCFFAFIFVCDRVRVPVRRRRSTPRSSSPSRRAPRERDGPQHLRDPLARRFVEPAARRRHRRPQLDDASAMLLLPVAIARERRRCGFAEREQTARLAGFRRAGETGLVARSPETRTLTVPALVGYAAAALLTRFHRSSAALACARPRDRALVRARRVGAGACDAGARAPAVRVDADAGARAGRDERRRRRRATASMPPRKPPQRQASRRRLPRKPKASTIVGIEVEDNRRIATDDVLSYVKEKVGQPFKVESLAADVRSLWDSGFFDDIQVDLAEVAARRPPALQGHRAAEHQVHRVRRQRRARQRQAHRDHRGQAEHDPEPAGGAPQRAEDQGRLRGEGLLPRRRRAERREPSATTRSSSGSRSPSTSRSRSAA